MVLTPRGYPAVVLAIASAACALAPQTAGAPAAGSAQLPAGARIDWVQPGFNPTLPACPGDVATPLLSVVPMAPGDYVAFRPLGFISHPIWVLPAYHSSFAIAEPGQTVADVRPVRAPADGWVALINKVAIGGGINYQVYFQPCAEFVTYFNHLKQLSEPLAAELARVLVDERSDPDCRYTPLQGGDKTSCDKKVLVPVKAGEVLGRSGDGAGVDFGAYDKRVVANKHAVPGHYSGYRPYVSPVPYLAPDARAAIAASLGSVMDRRVKRTALPLHGEYVQDLEGTAQGNWFSEGRFPSTQGTPFEPTALALVHDYVAYDGEALLSIGASALKGGLTGIVGIKAPLATTGRANRDWRDVKADGPYCYDAFATGRTTGGLPLTRPTGILLVRLVDALHLQVENVTNSAACPADPAAMTLSGQATTFER
ncbi:MAG: hypothetical protein FJZ01_04915 [Candidatus Sericytochromatia bacterium]|nr:hypothetical protein [Candidatus Tanganyikabacteria bacterium]